MTNKLTFKNFFEDFFLLQHDHPQLRQKDHEKTLWLSIALGILTLGTVHGVCFAIRSIQNRISPLQGNGVSNQQAETHHSPNPSPKRSNQKTVTQRSKSITIGTYNILFPQARTEDDGRLRPFSTAMGYVRNRQGRVVVNTDVRMETIIQNLNKAALDIFCLQELVDKTYNQISTSLEQKYASSSFALHERKDGVAIFYNKKRFKLLNQHILKGTFRTQKAHNAPVDRSRSAILVDLQDQTTKKIIRVVSTHCFDPRAFGGDKEQFTKWLMDEVEQVPCTRPVDCTIIAGDMNQDQYGDRGSKWHDPSVAPGVYLATSFGPFIEKGYIVDDNLNSSEYQKDLKTNAISSKERKIDWIWVRGGNPIYYPLSQLDISGSDHTLVASKIEL